MPEGWVDFKAIKEAVTMQMVLDHYHIDGLEQNRDELRGRCPIHGGSTAKKHFSVNLSKNAFKCFYSNCGAHGNILDFVAAKEHCSVRDAALRLQDWFKVGEPEQSENQETVMEVRRGIYQDQSGGLYEVVATAAKLDDLQELVVFRELFEGFHYWVASPQLFDQSENPERSEHVRRFTLVKTL